jgi:hypothetical protein
MASVARAANPREYPRTNRRWKWVVGDVEIEEEQP